MERWRGKRVLLISPERWGPVRLSKHHYAATLASAGAKVWFMDPPDRSLRRIVVEETDVPGVFHVAHPGTMRGLRFFPSAMRSWFDRRQMERISVACHTRFDVVWNYDLFQFGDLKDDRLAPLRIVHVMDLPEGTSMRTHAANAHAVLAISERIAERARWSGTPSLCVPHAAAMRTRTPRAPELPKGPGMRLGYLGNFAKQYIHWPSLIRIAERCGELGHDLYLIGPWGGQLGGDSAEMAPLRKRMEAMHHVHCTGAIDWNDIPGWLEQMDLLLIVEDPVHHPMETAHPHKVPEYLASGRMVLSTFMEDYQDLTGMIRMIRPEEKCEDHLDRTLADLEKWNADDLVETRRRYAREHSYPDMLARITDFLAPVAGDVLSPALTSGSVAPGYQWAGQRVLVVSPQPWGPVRLSKHHYATTLAEQGAQVWFLDPPVKGLRGIDVHKTDVEGVMQIKRGRDLRGVRFLPASVRSWLDARRLRRIADACGTRFDVIWNFDLFELVDLDDDVEAPLRILHVMDLPRGTSMDRALRCTHVLFAVSDLILAQAPPNGPPKLRLPHGWAAMPAGTEKLPVARTDRFRIGYLGNLANRFLDWPALIAIAEQHPDHDLYLMGPYGGQLGVSDSSDHSAFDRIRQLPNVIITGPVHARDVPAWLARMDLLVLAYDTRRFAQEVAHPHKVLDYLASGVPVVASYMADYQDLRHLVRTADPMQSVDKVIDEVLNEPGRWYNADIRNARIRFARDRGYVQLLQRAAEFIGTVEHARTHEWRTTAHGT